MIRIFVNNQQVYLDPKTSLRFDLVHPAFESEYLHASMVYPFNIPAHKNESVFNHSNHIIVNKKYRIYDCTFSYADAINFTGKLVLSKLSKTTFRGSIIMNGFSVDSKDISLQDFTYDSDVNLGNSTAAVTNYIEAILDDSYPDVNFNFPYIHVPNWYGENQEHNPDFQNYVNFYNRVGGFIQENNISETAPNNYNSLLPCLYMMYVIEKCFDELGFKATGDFLSHPELSQLIIFYNVPLDFGQGGGTVRAEEKSSQTNNSLTPLKIQFNDDYNAPNQDPDDAWSTANDEYTIQNEGFHDFIVTGIYNCDQYQDFVHELNVYIRDTTAGENLAMFDPDEELVYETDTEFSVQAISIWFPASKIGHKISVYGVARYFEGSLQGSQVTFSNMVINAKNASECNFNSFKKTLHYADHVPDISFGKFISAIAKAFGLYFLFDHEKGIVEINFLKDLINSDKCLDLTKSMVRDSYEISLKEAQGINYQFNWDGADFDHEQYYIEINADKYLGEYDSIQDLPIPAELNVLALVRNLNTIYVYTSYEATAAWNYYCFNYAPYLTLPQTDQQKIDFSPLMMKYESVGDEVVPTSLIKCSSHFFPTGVNKCDLHLVFYRGLDGQSLEYPFATSLTYDRFGDQSWGHSLRLDGDQGLMASFLQDWLDFVNNSQQVKMDLNMDLIDLANIMKIFIPQMGTKYHKIQIENVNYLPKKFSFMLTMNGITSCQATLIKEGMIQI